MTALFTLVDILLFMSVLIGAYFYLQSAKARDDSPSGTTRDGDV